MEKVHGVKGGVGEEGTQYPEDNAESLNYIKSTWEGRTHTTEVPF